jgi:uncharacterized delta-60 repeat protein
MKYYMAAFMLLFFAFLTSGVSAQTFSSALNGAQEIPPNASTAVGVGTVILNAAETQATVTLYFSGLGSAQTTARIYNSGGVVFNLPAGNFSQSFPVSPAQAAELKSGAWYFDVASTNFPNGEIRGPIGALSSNNAVPFPFSNGSLDPTFDTDGVVTTEIGGGNNVAQAVAVQTDGKIVVAGFCLNGTTDDFAVARYNPNGTLDETFDGDSGSGNGVVITTITANHDEALALALQPDGKILLAGQTFNGANTDIALVRYNQNGTLDNSFGGGDGIVTTPTGTGSDLARSIALQADGKIVVTGQSFNGVNNDIPVVRYNSNGSLDPSFNNGGIILVAIGPATDTAYGVLVQTDGKIVVAGYYFNGTNNDAVVLRLAENGALDPGFGTGGIVTTAIGGGTEEALALALQPDGKIVVAGCVNSGGGNDFLLVRYNSNGSPDTGFGTNGATVTPIGNGPDIANGVTIQADGKIVAAGFSSNGANNDFAVIRRNPDGSLDPTFDADGRLTTPLGTSTDTGTAVAVQADGKIVVVGRTVTGATADFGVARYGYGTNAPANDGFFSLNPRVQIRFGNAFGAGASFANSINSLSLPPLPNKLGLLTTPRSIRTEAAFSGEILIKFILPARVDAANFAAAQILHFENGAWIDRTANAPPRDFPTRSIYARVSTLSVFAIVSPLAQTPQSVDLAGRILSASNKPVSKAAVTITGGGPARYALSNPFGYFRFRELELGRTYVFSGSSKHGRLAPQILTLDDELDELNFILSP